jgi:hypothetical protein
MIEVCIRHYDETDRVHFTEVEDVAACKVIIDDMKSEGGVYFEHYSTTYPFHSYNYVVDGSRAFIELVFGEE